MKLRSGNGGRSFWSTRHPAGLTLVEVMVTFAIFLTLAGLVMMAVREIMTQWQLGERRRVIYEKAAGALDTMATDIRLALTQEPRGTTETKVKFIGDIKPGQGQRLMFVRAFESGPERALTLFAGDGQPNETTFAPINPDANAPAPEPNVRFDADSFNGVSVGDYRALGGMAAVGYYVSGQTLYRAIRSPVGDSLQEVVDGGAAQVVATDVLYHQFEYWGQFTSQWEDPGSRSRTRGAESVWDSTRGINTDVLRAFVLHRQGSDKDPEDDVFPRMVRITLTVDSPMPRCLFTKIETECSETDGEIMVASTKGFPDADEPDPFIYVDGECMRIKARTPESFIIAERGARGTVAKIHKVGTPVRVGKTFRRIVYLPNFREDFTSDEQWAARREALFGIRRKKGS